MTTESAEALAFALLTTPRSLAEWHEDMGPQLWWGLEDGKWLGEPPYCGTPLDLGFEVAISVVVHTAMEVMGPTASNGDRLVRTLVGGWPGYHTHFTPLPPMPEVPK